MVSADDMIDRLADELRDDWLVSVTKRLDKAREDIEDAARSKIGLDMLLRRLKRISHPQRLDDGVLALATWLVALLPDEGDRARVLERRAEIVAGWCWERCPTVSSEAGLYLAALGIDGSIWPDGFTLDDAPALVEWMRDKLPNRRFARDRANMLVETLRSTGMNSVSHQTPCVALDDGGRVRLKDYAQAAHLDAHRWAPLSGLAWIHAADVATRPAPTYDRSDALFVADTGRTTVRLLSSGTGANLEAARKGTHGKAAAFEGLDAKFDGVRFRLKLSEDYSAELPFVGEDETPIDDTTELLRRLQVQPWMGEDGVRDVLALYLFAHLGAIPGGGVPLFMHYEDEHFEALGYPEKGRAGREARATFRQRIEQLGKVILRPIGPGAKRIGSAAVVNVLRSWSDPRSPRALLLNLAPALYTRTRDEQGQLSPHAFPMSARCLRDRTPYVTTAAYHSSVLLSSAWRRNKMDKADDGRVEVQIGARNMGDTRLGMDSTRPSNLPKLDKALETVTQHGAAEWSYDGPLTWDTLLRVRPHSSALSGYRMDRLRDIEAPRFPRDAHQLVEWIEAETSSGATMTSLARDLGVNRPHLYDVLQAAKGSKSDEPLPLPREVRKGLRKLYEGAR